jgi:hypothetical protein
MREIEKKKEFEPPILVKVGRLKETTLRIYVKKELPK